MESSAALVLTGGILPTSPHAETVVLREGVITWVGRFEERPEWCREAHTWDLAGCALLPGFIDGHTHFVYEGLRALGLRTQLAESGRSDALELLAEAVRATPAGTWAIGVGWDESTWEPAQRLSRAELDRIAPHTPLAAIRVDGHLAIVNRVGLDKLPPGIDARQVDSESGSLLEEAAFTLSRSTLPATETLVEGLCEASRTAHRLGVTSVHAMAAPAELRAYVAARRLREMRVTLYPEEPLLDSLRALGIDQGFGDPWLRLGGIKLFADGSIGAANAAVHAPFADTGGRGRLNHTDEHLRSFLRAAEEAGMPTAVHAIGDRAIEQVISAHEAVGTSRTLRHRIEHFELPREGHVERAAALGLWLSMQPNFVGRWSGPDSFYERRLGAERDRTSNPHATIAAQGLPLVFGSDGMPMGPLLGIHGAVNAPYVGQRLSVADALHAYTAAGAAASFEEESKGEIAPGHIADLVVLNGNPVATPGRIRELRVEMTFLGGKVVYQHPESASRWPLPSIPG